MSVLDSILSGLSVVGNVLDTPGGALRNVLSGRNMFDGLNPFDAEGRASGRDMLESWGALGANEEGLDRGDVYGFLAEMAFDPMNAVGLGAAAKAVKAAKAARATNRSLGAAADAAANAARFQNLESDRLLARAAEASRMQDEARIFSRTGMVEGKPDTVVDLLRMDPNLSQEYDGIAKSFQGAILTDAEKLRLLHGTQDESARLIGMLTGHDLTTPHPAVSAMYGKSGVRPIGIDVEGRLDRLDGIGDVTRGFVLKQRPDMAFVQSGGTMPQQIGTGAHEAVHSLSVNYPDLYNKMEKSAGKGIIDRFYKTLGPYDQEDWMFRTLTQHPKDLKEEAIALEFGNSVIRGTPKQKFPAIDNAFMSVNPHNPPDAGVVDEMARLLKAKGVFPDFGEARAVAEGVFGFLSGNARQQHALVRTGRGSQFTPYKSFADLPQVPDVSGVAFRDVARPDISDLLQREPRIAPLLAAMFGHNAGRSMAGIDTSADEDETALEMAMRRASRPAMTYMGS